MMVVLIDPTVLETLKERADWSECKWKEVNVSSMVLSKHPELWDLLSEIWWFVKSCYIDWNIPESLIDWKSISIPQVTCKIWVAGNMMSWYPSVYISTFGHNTGYYAIEANQGWRVTWKVSNLVRYGAVAMGMVQGSPKVEKKLWKYTVLCGPCHGNNNQIYPRDVPLGSFIIFSPLLITYEKLDGCWKSFMIKLWPHHDDKKEGNRFTIVTACMVPLELFVSFSCMTDHLNPVSSKKQKDYLVK